jgi:hypothetical protein
LSFVRTNFGKNIVDKNSKVPVPGSLEKKEGGRCHLFLSNEAGINKILIPIDTHPIARPCSKILHCNVKKISIKFGSVLGIRIQGQENEEISVEKCTF